MAVKVLPRKSVNLLASPPKDKDKDEQMVRDFMKAMGKKVVCGGSSANMVGRVLSRRVSTALTYSDPDIPPIGRIEGIDLVTEGVLTMARTLELLRAAQAAQTDTDPFKRLDEDNGAARARAAAARGLHAPSPLRGHGGQPRAPEPKPARGSDDQVQAYR